MCLTPSLVVRRRYYISFFKYGLSALVENLWRGFEFDACDPDTDFCPFGVDGDGSDVMAQFGVQGTLATNLVVCVAYTAAFVVVGYLVLVHRLGVSLREKGAGSAPDDELSEELPVGINLKTLRQHFVDIAPSPRRAEFALHVGQ